MAFSRGSYSLLAAASSTGSAIEWGGGRGTFVVVSGTFGGATVALQWSVDEGSTWQDVDQGGDTWVTKTAAGGGNFELPYCQLRARVTGGTPSNLVARVLVIDE